MTHLIFKYSDGFGVPIGVQLDTECWRGVEDVVRQPGDREVVDQQAEAEHGVGGRDTQPAWPRQQEVWRLEAGALKQATWHLQDRDYHSKSW